MVDLLRIYGHGALSLLIGIAVLFIAAAVINKYALDKLFEEQSAEAKKTTRKIVWIIAALAAIGYGFFLISSLSVNVTPRGVIDRSQAVDQQKAYEQRQLNKSKGESQ